jgi:hypothetical protein
MWCSEGMGEGEAKADEKEQRVPVTKPELEHAVEDTSTAPDALDFCSMVLNPERNIGCTCGEV